MKKLYLISIAILLSLTSFGQTRPNRFTTNGDPGAWVYLPMPALTAYANGTNFFVDWTTNAYNLNPTGDIWFQYSTNWGLPGTNRFAVITIPPRQNYRHVYFANAATNWHNQTRPLAGIPTGYGATIKFIAAGSGETNVSYTPDIDAAPTGTNWQGNFTPSSIGGLILWLEASQQIYQDEYALTPAVNGSVVRYMGDLSGTITTGLTNVATTTSLYYRNPNNSPGNIPALDFEPLGSPALTSKTFTAPTQPNWCFMAWYGRGKSLVFLDGLSEGNRFACFPAESPVYTMQMYSGTTLAIASGSGKIEWRIFSFKQNGSSAIIRTNGVQAGTGNGGTQTPTRWTVGADYNAGVWNGDPGYMAELLVYHADLTAGQITNVESYLWNKYGTPHP